MMSLLRLVALTLSTCTLLACAGTPPRQPSNALANPEAAWTERRTDPRPVATRLSSRQRDAMAVRLLNPKPHVLTLCVVSGLELNAGLVHLKRSGATDDEVRTRLVAEARGGDPSVRERQFAAWQKGATPADLADLDFTACLARNKIPLPPDPSIKSCFELAALPAYAESEKGLGHDLETAVTTLERTFTRQVPADTVRKVTEDVFRSDAGRDGYEAHRRVFAQCILSGR